MKKSFCFLLLAAALLLPGAADFRPAARSPRNIRIGKKVCHTLTPGNFEVVRGEPRSGTANFAADELARYLGEALKCKVPVVTKPSGKRIALIVGSVDKSETGKLDRDGFIIRSQGNTILIAGHDEGGDPAKYARAHAKGTLFGVYDFLERFAGVRFYFPGEFGVVVPSARKIEIPEVNIVDRPDMQFRSLYLNQDRPQMEGQEFVYEGISEADMRRLLALRTRSGTMFLPNCHGLARLGYVQRFGKSHPEYFALKPDGTRYNRPDKTGFAGSNENGQLCFSSAGLKEEIYLDAVAVLTGKPASSRNVIMPNGKCYWSGMFRAPYFNIMPNDSMPSCACDSCRPKLNKGDKARSEFYWDFFIDVAERLQKNRIPGFVTTMAYHPYHLIPDRPIPSNMIVMLALSGAWSEGTPGQAQADARIRDWVKKLGAKTYLWTYANKQHMPWVPNFAPRTVGKYYARQAPCIFGTFFEGESDIWLYSYLNYYVLSRVLWDPSVDVDSIVEEHYKKMFGPAAPEMKEFFDTIENKWMKQVVGNIVETSVGPIVVRPPEYRMWSEIFSPAFFDRARKLFADAEKKAAKEPQTLARIRFFRRNYLANMEEGARRFAAKSDERTAWQAVIPEISAAEKPLVDGKITEKAWFKVPPIYLVPRLDQKNEVKTLVRCCRDKDNLYFAFICEEPFTADISIADRKRDDRRLWEDNSVEILLDTDGRRQFHQQFMINSNGVYTDLINRHRKADYTWNCPAEVRTTVTPGKEWCAEVRIPLAGLAPMTRKDHINANFTRIRMLRKRKVGTLLYTWCRMTEDHRPEEFGVLRLDGKVRKNLLADGDFGAKLTRNGTYLGRWVDGRGLQRDTDYWKTAGASLRLDEKHSGARQWFRGLKPDTEYEFSFYVRLDKVEPNGTGPRGGLYARINDSGKGAHYLPKIPLTGTLPWTRQRFRFRTSKGDLTPDNTIDFNFYRVRGQAWIDHVEIREVEKEGKSAK
ncbi:MAG: DUF4838 domain-containing protein [Lentisphaeria bacterium]|nr:DUF4838 domain-containing protein [Lentisphaeria bacterium]